MKTGLCWCLQISNLPHTVQTCSEHSSPSLSCRREGDVEGAWWQPRPRHPEPPGSSPAFSTSSCCFLTIGPHGAISPLTLNNEVLPCSKSFLKAVLALVCPPQAQTLPSPSLQLKKGSYGSQRTFRYLQVTAHTNTEDLTRFTSTLK